MRLNDDYDDFNREKSSSKAAIVAIAAIVVVVVIVLLMNKDYIQKHYSDKKETVSSVSNEVPSFVDNSENVTEGYQGTGLHVSDLDFYESFVFPDENLQEDDNSEEASENKPASEEIVTEANDGKHTLITHEDYSTEWVAISPYLTKNELDYTKLFNQGGKLKYYEGENCVSYYGIDISKDQNYIDFNKVKKDGVQFVMIRLGQRGYQSGTITLDDYFKDNLKRATDAGLMVGVTFLSQAVTKEEAAEEANWIIQNTAGYTISYPVVCEIASVRNEKARTDDLSKEDRTTVIRSFFSTLKDAGLKPVLCADKKVLIKDMELSKIMGEYDVWLNQPDVDLPDYPYLFSMWRYSTKGQVDGIAGNVSLDISFIDYSLK